MARKRPPTVGAASGAPGAQRTKPQQDILAPRSRGEVEITEASQRTVALVFALVLAALLAYAYSGWLRRLLRPAWKSLDAWWNPMPELPAPPPPQAAAAEPPASKAKKGGSSGSGRGKGKAEAKGSSSASSSSSGGSSGSSKPSSKPSSASEAPAAVVSESSKEPMEEAELWSLWPAGSQGRAAGEAAAEEGDSPWEVVGSGDGGGRARAASPATSVDSQPPELLEEAEAEAAAAGPAEALCPCCGHALSQAPPGLLDCGRVTSPMRLVYDSAFGLLPFRDLSALRQQAGLE